MPLGRVLQPLFGLPIPMFIWGKWWCPFFPNSLPHPSRIYVGQPVVTKDRKITDVEVDFWSEMAKLQKNE
jgi:hypothetical protein